jgi:hypothetical protein
MDSDRSSKRRVMVYELTVEGDWESKGKGYIHCKFIEVRMLRLLVVAVAHVMFHPFFQEYNAVFLNVQSEDDDTIILNSKIQADPDVYQTQGGREYWFWSDSARQFIIIF